VPSTALQYAFKCVQCNSGRSFYFS
jgi:hypothetical protein